MSDVVHEELVALPGFELEVLDAYLELATAGRENPLEYTSPTPPQLRWHKDPSPRKLLRGPNQAGKTHGQARELLWRMVGAHPYLETHEPPIECWLVCSSWKQSKVIMAKVWELVPKNLVAKCVHYTRKNGFTGGWLELKNGSYCQFVTCHQDTTDLGAATLHYMGVDELPFEHLWGELSARLSHYPGATMGLTLTPIGRPNEFIREKVESGEISDTVFSLTVDNCTPLGGLPFRSVEQIREMEVTYLGFEKAQRIHGAWEGVSEGRCLEAFRQDNLCDDIDGAPDPEMVLELGVGIDHGAKAGRQSITLVFVGTIDGELHAWIWDEWQGDGRSSEMDDARGFLNMLHRNDIRLEELDHVVGDRSHAGDWRGNAKSNRDLKVAIARLSGYRPYKLPPAIQRIRTPRKWSGSVGYGLRLMNKMFAGDRLHVHRRCIEFIKATNEWQGEKQDPAKDRIDSARYILEGMIDARRIWTPTGYHAAQTS